MNTKKVLIDTGPLVALLYKNDNQHFACNSVARQLTGDIVTCWPVVTEAAWLLRNVPNGLQCLFTAIQSEYHILPLGPESVEWIGKFLDKYRDLPAQVADAALMYLVDRESIDTVFTLDERDFSVYRTQDRRPMNIIPAR